MAQNRCSHDTAMTILEAASSGRNIRLNAVAATVVQSIGQDLPSTHLDTETTSAQRSQVITTARQR